MRALIAASMGLTPVLLLILVLAVTNPAPEGETSPRPLLTTVPGPKK
ncbi:SPW_0924 family protein [Streptomyces ficellus]|uniref:SPW_0924 family protein n=1 Tax=Streptomyces ficellus TaxID=1977088 RepID=A0A6I6FDE3_9ACTN|nr:SPW_0924 family protein [Streptomyces ficellus]QGV81174.1 SPW_0924 family protein [Streptomyces ficellus]